MEDYVHPGEVSLGELYCIYSAALQLTPRPGHYGFDCPLSAGGKLMGLAAHGGRVDPPEGVLEWDGEHLSIGLDHLVERLRSLGHVERESLTDLGMADLYEPMVQGAARAKELSTNGADRSGPNE